MEFDTRIKERFQGTKGMTLLSSKKINLQNMSELMELICEMYKKIYPIIYNHPNL